MGVNQTRLKQLRLRVETDRQFVPGGRRLKVQGRDLDDLPPELFLLVDLDVLDLTPERQSCLNHRVSYVPPEIGRLANLRVLMLDTNALFELPEEMALLGQLEMLSLSNNHLSRLPKNFERLKTLKSLHVANNYFTALPTCISLLKELRFVDFSDNRLFEITESIGKLPKLETLLVYNNCVGRLPNSLCGLSQLRTLWVGNNFLKRLPRNFGRLSQLDWGKGHTISATVDGNPLEHPPLDVCKLGVQAIGQYFHITEPLRTRVGKRREGDGRMFAVPEETVILR